MSIEQTTPAIKAGIDHFNSVRSVDDIDLIQEVRTRLMNSGLGLKISDCYNSNRFIIEAENKPSSVQRFLLNKYWNQQLMRSSKMSIEERYCLIANGTIEDWLRLFETKVLPFVIENNLPVVL